MCTACKTRVLTHFPASDDSGLSSQMLCIFLVRAHRHTPLSTVLVFSEYMYCRAQFNVKYLNSHIHASKEKPKKKPGLFFLATYYITGTFSPWQKMTSGCVLSQLLPLEHFVYHHKSVCFIATLLTARRYYSCCNQLYW